LPSLRRKPSRRGVASAHGVVVLRRSSTNMTVQRQTKIEYYVW
jgi:hypothetical protein